MTEQEQKTFTQEDFDKFKAELDAKHQEDLNSLAGKLRAEFKEKEQKAKAEAEKAAELAIDFVFELINKAAEISENKIDDAFMPTLNTLKPVALALADQIYKEQA